MAKKRKDPHVGGQQMPMFLPTSTWERIDELPDLRRVSRIAFDTEEKDDGLAQKRGPGWAYGAGHIVGASAAWQTGSGIASFYAPIRHPDSDNFDPDQLKRWYADHVKAGVRFVMQNAPYDVGWTNHEWGVPCPAKVDDTTCMAYMVDETRLEYGLDALCKWQGLEGKDETLLNEALDTFGFPTGDKGKAFLHRLPARYVGPYAEIDAVRTLQLADKFLPQIEEQRVTAAYQLEMDLLPVVHAMRKRGIRVDLEQADRTKDEFVKIAEDTFRELTKKLNDEGFPGQVGIDEARSNPWLCSAFMHCKQKYPEEKGVASFEAKWMKNRDHWLPQLLVRGKSYHDAAHKFMQTYVIDFAHLGRLHASINQFKSEDGGTRTYRFSYSDPPLQQMPNRDEGLAAGIRGCFLPEPGELWLSADYSQQEYRLIVHFAEKMGLSGAKAAADRYRSDPRTDFHSMIADMTGLDRKSAKDANFAKSYGAGIPKFAAMINKSEEEAGAIMKQYDKQLPFNKQLNERCQSAAERKGYVLTLDGARIHFPLFEAAWLSREENSRGWGSHGKYKMSPCSEEEARERQADKDHPWHGKKLRRAHCRKAMNGKIQGSAARQTKKAMKACWDAGHVPLLQMHDELDFSVSEEGAGTEITKLMREVYPLNVPMMVDAEYGVTWGKAKADKKTGYDASWAMATAALAKSRGSRAKRARV